MLRMETELKCSMCPLTFTARNKWIIHILKIHQTESRFRVACLAPTCKFEARSWTTFRQHCRRHHKEATASDLVSTESHGLQIHGPTSPLAPDMADEEVDGSNSLHVGHLNPHERAMRQAQLMLHLETKHHVSQEGIKELAVTMDLLVGNIVSDLKANILSVLPQAQHDAVERVLKGYDTTKCEQLSNPVTRHGFYKRHFGYIPPTSVHLGFDSNGRERTCQIVQMKPLLAALLNIPDIWEKAQVWVGDRKGDILHDMSDGSYIQDHPLNQRNKVFLKIVGAYDDIEIANPLRPNRKTSVAMFYFTLINFPAQSRSQLSNIFTFAIAKRMDVKRFGVHTVLKDFVDSVQELKSKGFLVNVQGADHVVHGDLIAFMCDNPAAGLLGGFKESVSASRFCRTCMAHKLSYKDYHNEKQFSLRTQDQYELQCDKLENPALVNKKTHWAQQFGVNSRSVLCSIEHLSIPTCLLQDPMHILLEGCVPLTLALFLKRKILEDKVFSLDQFNEFIAKPADFAPDTHSPASTVDSSHILANIIKQKASVMLKFTYMLPLFLGKYFTCLDREYENLLSLFQITRMCFLPRVDKTVAGVLEAEIAQFFISYRSCYGRELIKPKMHFLLHLPRQLLMYGPLRQQSCMRFESKHGEFKDHRWRNFRNLPLSMLTRHQLKLLHGMTNSLGQPVMKYLHTNDQNSLGHGFLWDDLTDAEKTKLEYFGFEEGNPLSTHKCVTVRGKIYKPNCALLLHDDEIEGPTFCEIIDILQVNLQIVFKTMALQVMSYEKQFLAYHVQRVQGAGTELRMFSDLHHDWPLPIHKIDNTPQLRMFVVNRYGLYECQ